MAIWWLLPLECLHIDDIATIPDFQKKGYTTGLMHAALKHAQQLNIEQCFLEASSSGLGLYKRMGFKELFINNSYKTLKV